LLRFPNQGLRATVRDRHPEVFHSGQVTVNRECYHPVGFDTSGHSVLAIQKIFDFLFSNRRFRFALD
jgi:hypothetical protein